MQKRISIIIFILLYSLPLFSDTYVVQTIYTEIQEWNIDDYPESDILEYNDRYFAKLKFDDGNYPVIITEEISPRMYRIKIGGFRGMNYVMHLRLPAYLFTNDEGLLIINNIWDAGVFNDEYRYPAYMD